MNEHPEPGTGAPDLPPREPPAAEPPDAGPPELAPAGPEQAEATGHPAVDASLRALAEVADADPAVQLPAYQAAHRTLRETLASIDDDEG